MMRQMLQYLRGSILLASAIAAIAGTANAAGTLITVSSATYNTNGNYEGALSVAVDRSGNIIVTGEADSATSDDCFTIKYDPNLVVIASATFNGAANKGDYGNRVAVDASNNIIVTGDSSNGTNSDYFTVKYSPSLVALSSAVFNGSGNGNDIGRGVAADSTGKIIVTGQVTNANNDYFTIKYDENLVAIASVTYNGPANNQDMAQDVAVDGNDNIIVEGISNDGSNYNLFMIKYDPNLVVISSATFPQCRATDMTIDGSNNIFMTGYVNNGSNFDYCTLKYSPNLVLLASATYNSPGNSTDAGNGVAVDAAGRIYVTGYRSVGAVAEYYTIKYDPNLVVLATAAYTGSDSNSKAYGIAVDSMCNIVVTGESTESSDAGFFTMKYNGFAPVISSVTPASAINEMMMLLTIKGEHFFDSTAVTVGNQTAAVTFISSTTLEAVLPPYLDPGIRNVTVTNLDGQSATRADCFTIAALLRPFTVSPSSGPISGGTTVTLKGGGFVSGAIVCIGTSSSTAVTVVSTSTIRCITPKGASLGAKNVKITLPDGQTVTETGAFTYFADLFVNSSGTVINPSTGGTATIQPESGNITVEVPGGAFETAVTLNVSTTAVPASSQSTVKVTSVGIEVTNSAGAQPSREITLTVYYRDADIAGLDEQKLTLARYESGRWVPIPTVVYADQNKMVGTVKHLSTFAVVQLVAAADLSGVKIYPNPYDPKNGSLTIANLTSEADIRIYNVAGELVRTLAYNSASGQAIWDGKNDSGNRVASGVYLAFIKGNAGKKTIKIAVEK